VPTIKSFMMTFERALYGFAIALALAYATFQFGWSRAIFGL